MTPDEMIEQIARAICCPLDCEHTERQSAVCQAHMWAREARAAARVMLPALREKVERAHMTAAYDPAPYTKGKTAISALFDKLAKEIGS